MKSLGVYIDKHLACHGHIDKLCKKVVSAIGALKRVRSFITIDASTQIYQSLIQPHIDYCCTVWDGLGETLSTKSQELQNRAARVVMRSSYDTDASVLLDTLRWDNLSLRRQKFKLGLMFKALKSNAPSYLQEFFSIRETGYNIRDSEMRLNVPKPRTNYLKTKLLLQWRTVVE